MQPAFSPSRQRPALTFQDPAPAPAARPRPTAPPTNLPKSALEVVDFNQLLQEFQGRTQGGARQFAAQPAVPAVFQSANFPSRTRY